MRPLFTLFCLAAFQAFCQQPVFRHYTTADGLPSSETYCAIQDDKGYMWFGTDRGLARFNGYEFKVFTAGQQGLPDNTIFGLYTDHRNRIWYQSFSGYTGYWHTDSFYPHPYQPLIPSLFKGSRLEGFSIGRNDELMATWQHFSKELEGFSIDSKGVATSVRIDPALSRRDIYLSGNNTYVTISSAEAKTLRILSQETKQVLFTYPCPKTGGHHSIVRRKKNGDLVLYHADEIWLISGGKMQKLISCKYRVLSMILDKDENVCLGYLNKGLEIYLADQGYKNKKNLLSEYSISAIVQDHEGGFWFTTLEDGIFYLPPAFIMSYGKESGFSAPKVLRMEKTDKQLLFVLSDGRMASKALDSASIHMHARASESIHDLAYTPDGRIYYGTVKQAYPSPGRNYFHFPAQKIYQGHYHLWGFMALGIVRNIPGPDTLEPIITDLPRIMALRETAKDEILIGTLGGLFLWRQGKTISLREQHPFFRRRISDIIHLDETHMAFASIGYGIAITKKGDFTQPVIYTEAEGLPSNMCNILYRQSDRELIIGTNKGICRISDAIDPEKARIVTADISTGLISNEINDMEIVGEDLWIGTSKGVSVLPLKQLAHQTGSSFLLMEQVKVNDRPVNHHMRGLFSHHMNNLNFIFTGINFQHSSKLLYKYRLEGSGDQWNISAGRSVIYNALLPGNYTFKVILLDAMGKETSLHIRYSFSISPPFWLSWWFIVLAAACLVWLIYLLLARRIRYIREQANVQNDLNMFRDQALRAQMNPHFIYNSMNAIQNYIQKHETKASINYLSSFSRLMRMIFAHSGEKEVTLAKDLETVVLYIEMENKRFSGDFRLHITYGPGVVPSKILIPPFLIQPFVENAILHGFRPRVTEGNIWIYTSIEKDRLGISIKDDGIGRGKTLEASKRKQPYLAAQDRNSSGITVTEKRIRQAWENTPPKDFFLITDLYSPLNTPRGTLIEFYLPLIKL